MTNTRRWLANFAGNNFPLIGRLMWLVVEWLSLRGASLAIISITLTMHRLIFFRLESARESPCSCWSRPGNMLVLFSTLWLACAVLGSQGTVARRDSVIIFNSNVSRSLRVFVHSSYNRESALSRDSWQLFRSWRRLISRRSRLFCGLVVLLVLGR